MQVKDLRLKEMEQQLKEQRKKKNANLVIGIVISSTVGAIYGKYALGPVNNVLYKNMASPQLMGIQTVAGKSTITAGRGPGGLRARLKSHE
jgi:hypothetical protein